MVFKVLKLNDSAMRKKSVKATSKPAEIQEPSIKEILKAANSNLKHYAEAPLRTYEFFRNKLVGIN